LYEPLGFAFESEGFGSHAENITRDRFSFERMRARSLAFYGRKYVPFSWDELDKQAERCRQNVYELLGMYGGSNERMIRELTPYERELIRYAIQLNRPFRSSDVCYCLGFGPEGRRKVLRGLLDKDLVRPVGKGTIKIRLYEL